MLFQFDGGEPRPVREAHPLPTRSIRLHRDISAGVSIARASRSQLPVRHRSAGGSGKALDRGARRDPRAGDGEAHRAIIIHKHQNSKSSHIIAPAIRSRGRLQHQLQLQHRHNNKALQPHNLHNPHRDPAPLRILRQAAPLRLRLAAGISQHAGRVTSDRADPIAHRAARESDLLRSPLPGARAPSRNNNNNNTSRRGRQRAGPDPPVPLGLHGPDGPRALGGPAALARHRDAELRLAAAQAGAHNDVDASSSTSTSSSEGDEEKKKKKKPRVSYGHSMVVDPWGRVILKLKGVRPDWDGEDSGDAVEPGAVGELGVVDIDLEEWERVREKMPLIRRT
ncbi:hypothetical protein CHU98_g1781 [Xylaria longipes]|nr:hypothetical protein CHU98_g1781 [Xylaria longipes]